MSLGIKVKHHREEAPRTVLKAQEEGKFENTGLLCGQRIARKKIRECGCGQRISHVATQSGEMHDIKNQKFEKWTKQLEVPKKPAGASGQEAHDKDKDAGRIGTSSNLKRDLTKKLSTLKSV